MTELKVHKWELYLDGRLIDSGDKGTIIDFNHPEYEIVMTYGSFEDFLDCYPNIKEWLKTTSEIDAQMREIIINNFIFWRATNTRYEVRKSENR